MLRFDVVTQFCFVITLFSFIWKLVGNTVCSLYIYIYIYIYIPLANLPVFTFFSYLATFCEKWRLLRVVLEIFWGRGLATLVIIIQERPLALRLNGIRISQRHTAKWDRHNLVEMDMSFLFIYLFINNMHFFCTKWCTGILRHLTQWSSDDLSR